MPELAVCVLAQTVACAQKEQSSSGAPVNTAVLVLIAVVFACSCRIRVCSRVGLGQVAVVHLLAVGRPPHSMLFGAFDAFTVFTCMFHSVTNLQLLWREITQIRTMTVVVHHA